MRKDNERFNKIYEGNNLDYSIPNIKIGKEYQFIFRLLYDDICGPWTDIYQIMIPFEYNVIINKLRLLINLIDNHILLKYFNMWKIS